MQKQCDDYYQSSFIIGIIKYECTKRKNHFGRHRDAYGGRWKKGKK